MRARVAAATLHTQRDPRETTAAARRASLERYEKQVDPEGILPAKERKRRAKAAQKRQMQAMAYRSARARRQPKTRQQLQPGWRGIIRWEDPPGWNPETESFDNS